MSEFFLVLFHPGSASFYSGEIPISLLTGQKPL